MEQTCEALPEKHITWMVTPLGVKGGPALPVSVLDVRGRHLTIKLPQAIPAGALVKVETGDSLLLGEVCRLVGDGLTAEIMLSFLLTGLEDLQRLNRALLGEDVASASRFGRGVSERDESSGVAQS
jgi:hypothetical protein